ncbi:MAG: hypothetical protein ABR986_00615 [Methanomassiliicoccales archaeon]
MGTPFRHPYVIGHPLVDQEAVDRATVPNTRKMAGRLLFWKQCSSYDVKRRRYCVRSPPYSL